MLEIMRPLICLLMKKFSCFIQKDNMFSRLKLLYISVTMILS